MKRQQIKCTHEKSPPGGVQSHSLGCSEIIAIQVPIKSIVV